MPLWGGHSVVVEETRARSDAADDSRRSEFRVQKLLGK